MSFSNNKNPTYSLFLVLIFASSFILFTYKLGAESYWLDEILTFVESRRPAFDILSKTTYIDHVPLYFLIVHYWSQLFGESEVSIRLISVIFALGSVSVLYFIAKALFDEKVAFLSSILLGANPFFIIYAQEARMYTLATFFSLLSVYFFYKSVTEGKAECFILFSFFTLLNIYTHLLAFFVLAFELTACVIFIRKFERKFFFNLFFSLIPVFLLFTPKLFQVFDTILYRISWQAGSEFSLLPSFVTLLFSIIRSIHPCFLYIVVISSLLFFLLLFCLSYNIYKKDKFKGALLMSGFLTPLVLLYIQGLFSWITPRYIIFVLPISLIIISYGMVLLSERNKYLFYLVTSLLLFSHISALSIYYSHSYKEDWRSVGAHLSENYRNTDLIILHPHFTQKPFDYYFTGTDYHHMTFDNVSDFENLEHDDIQEYERLWFIIRDYKAGGIEIPSHSILDKLQSMDYVFNRNEFRKIDVYLLE